MTLQLFYDLVFGWIARRQFERTQAVRVVQEINVTGSVIAIIYYFVDGTITDTYIYGQNSTTEPIEVIRGDFVIFSPSNTVT